jgi:hypothetical protein
VVHRVRHGELEARGLHADGEHQVPLAQLDRQQLQQGKVDLGLGEVHGRDAQLAAQIGDGELLGEDLLAHQDACEPLAEGALQRERLGELDVAHQVGLAQDLAQLLARH